MRNLMPITRPMGAADLTQAAEDAGRYALALSDLSRAVAAYEAATGAAIAVVDADKAEIDPDETVFGSLDKTFRRVVEEYGNMDHAQIYRDNMATGTGFMQDDELRDAMYPQPVPEAGTVEDAVVAGAAAVADLVSEPVPPSNVQKMHNALPTWQGKAIPADLRDAVQHLAEIGTSGPKWGFAQDLDMIERGHRRADREADRGRDGVQPEPYPAAVQQAGGPDPHPGQPLHPRAGQGRAALDGRARRDAGVLNSPIARDRVWRIM